MNGHSDFENVSQEDVEIHSEQPSAIVKTSMLADSEISDASTTEMIQDWLAGIW